MAEAEEQGSSVGPAAVKSYVTMLNDLCCRRKITPVYQLISMEGMSHEPTFVYKVHADGMEAQGKGRKKQDARQLAAKNLLVRMNLICETDDREDAEGVKQNNEAVVAEDLLNHDGPSLANQEKATSRLIPSFGLADAGSTLEPVAAEERSPDRKSPYSLDTPALLEPGGIASNLPPGSKREESFNVEKSAPVTVPPCRTENPVGSLQELTLSIHWPPPRFDLSDREGAAHEVTFTMACYVWAYKSLGKGKSKKEAKRMAAYNMYELLRTSPEVLELWQKRAEAYAAKMSSSRNHRNRQPIPKRAAPLQDIHKDLMNSMCDSIIRLRECSTENLQQMGDPLGFLQGIATELNFDILFDDLFDTTRPPRGKSTGIFGFTGGNFGSVLQPVIPPNTFSGGGDGSAADSVSAGSLITLTLPRQVVCFGTGNSKSTARKSAVLNALRYLYTAAIPNNAPPDPVVDSLQGECVDEKVATEVLIESPTAT